ncbi:MAG TPA: hypothetical protein VLV83_06095 [Acidobacteriota bacterium]|nr:hypothetical protein [Acidobacteriota bacterium]
MAGAPHYDVVIIGAGLAGLSLSRQFLLYSDKSVLVLDKRAEVPPKKQKVGESLVQVGGYYLGKVLDLEEYLLCNHFMKYNLRFYWKSQGRGNDRFEDYSQTYIRNFSNIGCYQLDRNAFEGELLRLNQQDERFQFEAPVRLGEVDFADDDETPHRVRYRRGGAEQEVTCDWVVDASGRAKILARRKDMERDNEIRHGASFAWVEGLVDIDKLTDGSLKDVLGKRSRRDIGHLPLWLATNHFMGEGFWFWVIPLQGKTSLGLVYDRRVLSPEKVSSAEKLLDWACREFPLFKRDLPGRKVLDFGRYPDYSYDCRKTIDGGRWALTGESGRFTDPLYSPGSDFIAIHNTLIFQAVLTEDPVRRAVRCKLYELMMRSLYSAWVPAFAVSYDALGDRECFVLKYTWELSIYFSFFVFPFINGLMGEERFVMPYLKRLGRLGPLNDGVQKLLSDYFQWKKAQGLLGNKEPVHHELTRISTLSRAEKTFYRVDVSASEAREVLDEQLENLEELARFIAAQVAAEALAEPDARTNRAFVEGIDLDNLRFDSDGFRQRLQACRDSSEQYSWDWNPHLLAGRMQSESERFGSQVGAS